MTKTISQLLQDGIKKIDRTEVDILIAYVIKKPREFIIAHLEYKISKLKYYKIKNLISKRTKGIPIAYLTHHKEFYGLDFLVNKHTLIPRPETELLVEEVLKEFPPLVEPVPSFWKEEGQGEVTRKKDNVTLIDIGTGSGCIPISVLKSTNHQSPITTYATDISKPALKLAQKNATHHNVNIKFLPGNLLEPIIKTCSLPFVPCSLIITANLPYLTQTQFDEEPSIQHEPISALVAKDNGLELYKKLLKQISQLITSHQSLVTCFFEIDPSQTKKLSDFIKNILPNAKIEIFKDGMKNDRVVKITLQ